MRLESIIWLMITLSFLTGAFVFIWDSDDGIVETYSPLRSENISNPFRNYTKSSYNQEELTGIVNQIDTDVSSTNGTFVDLLDKMTFGATKAARRVKAGIQGMWDVADQGAKDVGLGADSDFNLPLYIMSFIGISATMGLIYLVFRIRSW